MVQEPPQPPSMVDGYQVMTWAWHKRTASDGWLPHGIALGYNPDKKFQPFIVMECSTPDNGETWRGASSDSYSDAFQGFWAFVDRAEPWYNDQEGPAGAIR